MKDAWKPFAAAVGGLAITVLVPGASIAQDQSAHHDHAHHYELFDLGTLGGPQSLIYGLTGPLNGRGTVAACADTTAVNPYADNDNPYITPSAFVSHAVVSRNGVFVDLGALPGGSNSCTQWINDRGWIVGGSENGAIDPLTGYPEVRAVLWKDGRIRDLGTLGGNESVASAINGSGQVAGFASNAIPDSFASSFAFGATQVHAFLWNGSALRDLGTLGGPNSIAFNLNDQGQVAGDSNISFTPNTTGNLTRVPFLWDRGTMINLGTLGGTYASTDDLNGRGQVVGFSFLAGNTTFHPFLWSNGTLRDLGTFGGRNGVASWLNDSENVVGWAEFPIACPGCGEPGEQVYHAALWKHGRMIDLGFAPGDRCSAAAAINSRGQIVGGSGICHGARNAFLWENGGPMIDLNSLVPAGSALHLTEADIINDHGDIAGVGVLPNGDRHTYLLVPCDDECDGGQTRRKDLPQR
jgi:probable HAF family extracellular repeat protein